MSTKSSPWRIVIEMYNGRTRDLVRIAASENQARQLGMLTKGVAKVVSVGLISREDYELATNQRKRSTPS